MKKYFLLLFIVSASIFSTEDILCQENIVHLACLQGNLETVKEQIENGADLNKKDQFGSTPLQIAVTFNRLNIVETLLNAGAEINLTNNDGSTPLQTAAFFGRIEIVRVLLEKGADKFHRNNYSSTAYDIVSAPFEYDKEIYDQMRSVLGQFGLNLDYELIKSNRPLIAEMLHPSEDELSNITYSPIEIGEWKISTSAEEGVDSKLIDEFYFDASKLETIYSLLVVKNGKLIAEKYFNDSNIDHKTRIQSVTKSVTSALIGIAIEKGCIKSTDEKMLNYFPEISDRITDARKNQITVEHLLQMRGGFSWEERDTTLWSGLLSGKYVPLIEEFELRSDPGAQFDYSNLTSNWLGIILARSCSTQLESFAQENLFDPLNIKAGDWEKDADGYNIGCGNLHLRARDAARFGLLYLNNGVYNQNQVLPSEWIEKSFKRYSVVENLLGAVINNRTGRYFSDLGYGYHWWSAKVGEHSFNYAWGHGGQLIILLHKLDMIIVVTSQPFFLQHNSESWIDEKAIINTVGKFISSLPVN